jgi:F-type H+-transporting ATPase subunit epsilon
MEKPVSRIFVKIVTPERTVFEGEVDSITLPTAKGQVTILPNHVPFITSIMPGETIIRDEKEEVLMAISGGFIEFNKNQLSILADTAERADEIDVERAEEARRKAEELKREKISIDNQDYTRVAAMIEKEMARIRVAKKHRTKHQSKLE